MKTARRSFGKPYECVCGWPEDCFVQCGDTGLVVNNLESALQGDISKENTSYTTAFFEAFPKNPSCFIRGEGKDVAEAELSAWNKYQKIITCNHEMERRNRRDGYGYCKHCSYSSMVFESLNKCCKCKIPTNYTTDYKGKHYCKKHSINKPKNPNPSKFSFWETEIKYRCSRKNKKILKKNIKKEFLKENIVGKVSFKVNILNDFVFTCNNKEIRLMFEKHKRKYLKK